MGSQAGTRAHGRRALAAKDDRFFAQHGWRRVPRLVQWMATLRCPLSCPHCLAAGEGSDMSQAHAARLIEQIAAMGVEELLVTGGEPLARDDLPEIIAILRANGVRWSLNTAAMPGEAVRRAMEAWPPAFVAVSLDGPRAVHDRFRGREGAFHDALASLACFADLCPAVAAGTTVTARSFPHLAETFAIVLESGATAWGLHLVVPEGRAAGRPDLFLSRRQLKGLLRFAAAKRNHFPVTMADEIGYCGPWEPLVRDEPFFCGAGRAQCVVLPDGEVVPCTTLDRSASAGNVLRRPLNEIWEHGFAELRQWQPRGRCGGCRYASACQGGCWLQRRHGTQCFREAWHVPGALTKAGLAVCLGLAASGLAAPRAAVAAEGPADPLRRGVPEEQMQLLQRSIIQWYAAQIGGRRSPAADEVTAAVEKALPDDPGARYFLAFAAGNRPADIAARTRQIEAALETKQRSLCLIDLAWRDVTEWCLDSRGPAERSAEERAALRRILASLGKTAEGWRAEIFREKLDPFLRRPLAYRRFFVSKAGPTPEQRLEQRIATSRGWTRPDLAESFLAEHPYAETMTLTYAVDDPARLRCLRGGEEVKPDGQLRVFDVLAADGAGPARLTLEAGRDKLAVALPPGAEATYADVLRLAWQQNREAVERLASGGQGYGVRRGPSPLALPVLRERLKSLDASSPSRYSLLWQLADLYLF